ncbi:DNRLRE domain-containing protein [Ruficoccus amylovorans]|uniref:DNRLRE domain-containing protein n=1 Tax=Ruficoccus amylovorans TaxID=1804625 RepID=A0A842HB87_9BACT|nr:DNRLRE domain-containing protein [Ruficoccus amylovorans]MBC2593665.1 DNRLRE domain-containing protein [Ruficoccus amylovorans]
MSYPVSHSSIRSLLAGGAVFIALSGAAAAANMSFQQGMLPSESYEGSASAYIQSGNSSGKVVFLSLKGQFKGSLSLGSNGKDSNRRRVLLSFDLSDLPQGAVVDTATLTLYASNTDKNSADASVKIDLVEMTTGFDPQVATWDTYADSGNAAVLSSTTANPGTISKEDGTIVFSSSEALVAALNKALASESDTVNLMIKLPDSVEEGGVQVLFNLWSTYSAGNVSEWRPKLDIDYSVAK